MVNEYRRRRRRRPRPGPARKLAPCPTSRALRRSPAAGRGCATRARISRRCATRAAPSSRCALSRESIQLTPDIRACPCCAVTGISRPSRDRRRTPCAAQPPVARAARASRARAARRRAACQLAVLASGSPSPRAPSAGGSAVTKSRVRTSANAHADPASATHAAMIRMLVNASVNPTR